MTTHLMALPSKGAIAEPTDTFLREAGLKVSRPNPRQYTGKLPAANLTVLFQRVKDVMYKVAEGTAHLGITGLDVVFEHPSSSVVVIHDHLGYGFCRLVVAVPEVWVDVESVDDLAELALDYRAKMGRSIRVATTYPHLARQFFHANGIHHFSLVKSEGAIEVAPSINYADIIVDLTDTGTTLRENHLKELRGGTIIEAQACLIGNKQALLEDTALREKVRILGEYIDAALAGKQYQQITVDVAGTQAEVAEKLLANPYTQGLLGPTLAPAFSQANQGEQWQTVTLTIKTQNLLNVVDYVRQIGGRHMIVVPTRYVFFEQSEMYTRLLAQLGLQR